MTVWNRLQRTQQQRLTHSRLITFSVPADCSVLLLDAKHFSIHKKPWTFYAALDGTTGQPLSWILLPRREQSLGYDLLLRHFVTTKRPIQAVVSDWHLGIRAAIADHFPTALHQRCAAHVLRDVLRVLGGRWWLATTHGRADWTMFRRIALGFPTEHAARRYLQTVQHRYPHYHKGWKLLLESLPSLYSFAQSTELCVPRTSNRIENFMGVLEQRLKVFRGLATPQTLIKIITHLILLKYKRPTN